MTKSEASTPSTSIPPTETVSETAKWFDAIVNGEFRTKLKNAIVHPSDAEFRALRGIFYYLSQYHNYVQRGVQDYPGDLQKQSWSYRIERQGMRDAVDWQKLSGFIEDYDLPKQRLKFRGVWYTLRDLPAKYYGKVFVPTGESYDV